jgi:hypothetical protein
MTTAAWARDAAATCQRLVTAIAYRDWDDLAACLDAAVQFRALTPSGLRTGDGRVSATSYFQDWFGEPDQLAHLSSDVRLIEDRLHVSYRFRAHKDRWYLIEQHAYCSFERGKITQIDLLCSGFRAEAPSDQTD